MKEIVVDTLLDALKLLPFLFATFLLMEFFEHKFSKKNKNKIAKAGKYGPILGSLLGAFPQCGFSVMATNLYATRIITLGTLISIYLSTSDEMLPILISKGAEGSDIIKILFVKVIIGIICGFMIDLLLKNKTMSKNQITDFCDEEHCDCKHGIFKSSLKHTINILIFILFVTFLLNLGMHYLGEDKLSKLFLKNNLFSSFITSLIGLIPNCGSSIILTELYLNDMISLASCIAGLLTGSGVALIVLFKVNKNQKENIKILIMLYLIGVISGILIEFIQILF